jgi:DNA mismatch repair protein MutS
MTRSAARATPVMQQHAAAKRAYPDAIVFFRLGDFYEMFEDDALLCAKLLDLTLTSRNKGKPDEVPMAGVPHHAAHGYVKKLLDLGHKVAICEQLADPSTVKGIVPREVVRVLTPGTVTNGEHLDLSTNNWLLGVDISDTGVGAALLDISTGELSGARFSDLAGVLGEVSRSAPREIVVGSGSPDALDAAVQAVATASGSSVVRTDSPLGDDEARAAIGSLEADSRGLDAAVSRAVARALRYARACNPGAELTVRRISEWNPSEHLVIDTVAQRHLELVESMSGSRETTLLRVIDETKTAAGARLLRRRLLAPLVDVTKIRRRLDRVELFVEHPRLRADLRSALSAVSDIERLSVRASLGEATPRDLGALRDGLVAGRSTVELLSAVSGSFERDVLGLSDSLVDTVDELRAELERALVERPPALAKEGAIFRSGYDANLDEAESLRRSGTELMVELETRLRAETGIPTVKVRFTRVFGWYVEVTRSHAARVPAEWRRKQTVAGGERFTLDELDTLADKVTHAEERQRERELELLARLVKLSAAASTRVFSLSERLSEWDFASSLAEVAHRYDYRRPEVDGSDTLEIVEGRHPVVERLAAAGRFVPNDVRVQASAERLWIVTGPNMAGKSTLLRQVALCVILAQLGAFVPAKVARIGVVDRVLSRVGASDNLAKGESTFMVEMRETAEILRRATARSLVILDEIGRGTSTFDGLAIAWAVAEYLDEAVGCRTLFATHYHELTGLAESSPHSANVSVSAEEVGGDVVFLHRLVAGPASRSYGVAVAKLAGLPESVLARSRALLEMLESGSAQPRGGKPAPKQRSTAQLALFAPSNTPTGPERETIETIRALDVERMTPLDALSLLARLRKRLE